VVKITNLLSDAKRGISVKSSKDYIHLSREGLTMKQLLQIIDFCNISLKQLSQMLSISERQLSRYKKDKILRTDISAHLIQIAELFDFGYEVFDTPEHFQEWMHSSIRALAHQKPIDLLDTPFGIQNVKTIIGRIEHSVYS